MELERKKKQSLKVFATKNEVKSKEFFSCILMLIFLCLLHAKYMPINANQQIHYSNGSLEEPHLQVETPIYDGHTR